MDHFKRVPNGQTTNPVGRPPVSKAAADPQPAEAEVADDGVSVAVRCPRCGRRHTLQIQRRRLSEERDCVCPCSPLGFIYRPATVRVK